MRERRNSVSRAMPPASFRLPATTASAGGNPAHRPKIDTMAANPVAAIPARHKNVNRAEVCDQNFVEFVRDWNGGRAAQSPARGAQPSSPFGVDSKLAPV